MRKFLSSTAGATFNQETPDLTFCVRKECVELIFKVKPAVYVIISMSHSKEGKVMLLANWDRYFERIKNPQVQMPQLKKCCPTVYAMLSGEDPDGVREYEVFSRTDYAHGFAIEVDVPSNLPVIRCIDKSVCDAALLLVIKSLKMYNELFKNPPFPAWKTGLDELWN